MTEDMRYRPQRGGLAQSLAETVTLRADVRCLVEHLRLELRDFLRPDLITDATVTVTPYGFDDRCGWDTHLVSIKGWGPCGMTDRMPEGAKEDG